MGRNWAEEFRRRVEESEGKYRPAKSLDDEDEEGEEKDEEDEDVAEEESDDVEQEDDGEEEAEEIKEDTGKPEIEKPLPTPVETPKLSLERQKFRHELDRLFGSTTIQPVRTEATKAEPVKPAKRETNEWAIAGGVMIGLMALSLMPTFYQSMTQAFQPLIQGFQSLSGRNYGTSAASQEWVFCSYCGYQCLGYNGMPCPHCGRS